MNFRPTLWKTLVSIFVAIFFLFFYMWFGVAVADFKETSKVACVLLVTLYFVWSLFDKPKDNIIASVSYMDS